MNNSKIKSLKDYLLSCPNEVEVFRFDTQEETDAFGNALRENARAEEDAPSEFDMVLFDVKISYLTVRVALLQPELVIN